jgi:chromate transporter
MMPDTSVPPPRSASNAAHLREIAAVFLKLGTIAFGGPAAHVAMMEDEVVRKRGWLSRADFLDYLGATNLIPGPNSTELAIHVGFVRAGWVGLVLAGACFIVPAALIVGAIAWGYVRYGALPAVSGLLYGIKPVVIAIVAHALVRLATTALRSARMVVVAVAAILAAALGVNELVVLGLAAVLALAAETASRTHATPRKTLGIVAAIGPWARRSAVAAGSISALSATPAALFGVFLKIGSVLFGSGYVLLAFLRNDVVVRHHWLTEAQLLDAVAVGQMTPGPVFTTATFVGYVAGGPWGAVAATVGIFLPAFVFVAASGPLVPRLRRSPVAGAVLDGVNAGSLALMAVVAVQLTREALPDLVTIVEAVAALSLLARFRVNSAWLVLAGAVLGLVVAALRQM